MTTNILYSPAKPEDFSVICNILVQAQLPIEDIDQQLANFFIAYNNNSIIGCIGMDQYNNTGLLRSMAVLPGYQNNGIAGTLVSILLEHAKQNNISTIYLITTTAERYFQKKGFITTRRENTPAAILQSPEFSHLCPSSATVMMKEL